MKNVRKTSSLKKRKNKKPQEQQFFEWVMLAAVPFAAVAATTVKSGVTAALLFSVLMILSMLLHSLLSLVSRLFPGLGMAVCSVVVMFMGGGLAYLVQRLLPGMSEAMGLFLYVPAAAVLVALPRRRFGFRLSFQMGLRAAGLFSLIVLPISLIRELFAYNRVWELALPARFTAPGARMPFFGYLLAGLATALVALLFHNKRPAKEEKPTEEWSEP